MHEWYITEELLGNTIVSSKIIRKVEAIGVELVRARIIVRGIVQGVGFRPFIYRLANDHELKGWVLNSTEGVVIEVEGPQRG